WTETETRSSAGAVLVRSPIGRQPHAGEGPARSRGEEVAVRDPGVAGRGRAAAAPEHVLVHHELAVVLADGSRRRCEPAVRQVGRRGPLPHLAVAVGGGGAGGTGRSGVGRRGGRCDGGGAGAVGRRLPFGLGRALLPGPARERV